MLIFKNITLAIKLPFNVTYILIIYKKTDNRSQSINIKKGEDKILAFF